MMEVSDIQTGNDAQRYIGERNVRFVKLWYSDVLGQLKSFSIPISQITTALDERMGFDGSSIEGFVRIEESDLLAEPLPLTTRELPWRQKDNGSVVSMYCNVYNPDGSRFEGDSFYILEKQEQKMRDMGFDNFYVGPELEFFLFRDKEPVSEPEQMLERLLDRGGYFSAVDDAGEDIRGEIITTLEQMGIKVEYSHHEVAPSQHEIDLRYASASDMAKKAMTYRVVVKEVAKKYGVYATFMPKPIYGENGSGMHVHQSLFKGRENAFFDAKDKYNLSGIGKSFIAGILRHAREIAAVTNPWVNSYQRLIPGYEAPTELSWARRNRSTALRVPMYKPGKAEATRVEVRFPDPSCNIALAFAMMLGAGLKGIEEGYELPKPVEQNVFEMKKREREKRGIMPLPGTLKEATRLMEESELALEVLGSHIHAKLIANQKEAWWEYKDEVRGKDRRLHLVTAYELNKLLSQL